MNFFLVKSDPQSYSLDDLARDKKTVWDGVRNPQAIKTIQAMQPGDLVLVYHSQGQSAIVGLAKVISTARPDPNDPKSWVCDFEFVRKFSSPVTLSEIKETRQFNEWSLVKQGRLSTMPAPPAFIEWLQPKVGNLTAE
jgi:predicted RNA-binding protein with PUA-like domain